MRPALYNQAVGPRTYQPSIQDTQMALAICDRFRELSSERSTFETHWEEIAEHMLPGNNLQFRADGWSVTPGEKKTASILESSPVIALKRCTAILVSLLTPPSTKWHKLRHADPELRKERAVQEWFEAVNDRLFEYRYGHNSNFQAANATVLRSLAAFGTGGLWIDSFQPGPGRKGTGLRYRAMHLGEYWVDQDHQGQVDTVFRLLRMTGREILQKWPAAVDRLPPAIAASIVKDTQRRFRVLHCITPNTDMKQGRADFTGMPWASWYVFEEAPEILDRGGYNALPMVAPRWDISPGELYGRSPAMDVLPSVKTLNAQKRDVLRQGQRAVAPVLLAHDDGALDDMDLRPGAVVYGGVSADGRPLIQTLPFGQPMAGEEMMDRERKQIEDSFFLTLFNLLVDTPTMTATEVEERMREKANLLEPTIGGLQGEYLGKAVERELSVLIDLNLLPPVPQEMIEAGAIGYQLEYDSPLVRLQRASEVSGISQSLAQAMEYATNTGDASVLDVYDTDAIFPEVAQIRGTPIRWLRSDESIEQIRADRAQQQQNEQLTQAAPGAAALLKAGAVATGGGSGKVPPTS